jgi:hypothetical protein
MGDPVVLLKITDARIGRDLPDGPDRAASRSHATLPFTLHV